MKIRIRGNSIRLRLTKSEVEQFGKDGKVTERTNLGSSAFVYKLAKYDGEEMSAGFEQGEMTIYIPQQIAQDWVTKEIVGFDHLIKHDNGEELYILLEKDFKCLDQTAEDQSDNYENPLAAQFNK